MAVTVRHLQQWKAAQEKFTVLTVYDYAFAKLMAQAQVPVLLVGDSLGQVVLGFNSTLPVTMEDMLRHTGAVTRGAPEALVVADLPFMSYQVCVHEAVTNAGRLLKEGGAQAVKLEGGQDMAEVIRAIVRAGIPVMGHIGLTPQAVNQLGGYKTQATDSAGERRLLADAKAVEEAGAFAVVLEKIPDQVAAKVTKALSIPTIGIGAGPACDGQVLVSYDLLGLFSDYVPPFVKQYAQLGETTKEAVSRFVNDVKKGLFPQATGSSSRSRVRARGKGKK